MNLKIILAIFFAFIITFSSLVIFSYLFPDTIEFKEREFYSQHFDPNTNKIFLIGSSHVGVLNTTLINEYVSKNHQDYYVYNLAYYGDSPTERLKTMKEIISLKPKIIFYGISYINIGSSTNYQILPDPQKLFLRLILSNNLGDDIILQNPKLATQIMIHDLTKHKDFFSAENAVFIQNTPFFPYLPSDRIVSTYEELKAESDILDAPTVNIDPTPNSQNVWALQEIINELHKNNIKVVLFATPHHKIYNDAIPEVQKENFGLLLQRLRDEGLKCYDLTERYENLLIFHDTNHVAFNKNSAIYSEDVAKIISSEIEP